MYNFPLTLCLVAIKKSINLAAWGEKTYLLTVYRYSLFEEVCVADQLQRGGGGGFGCFGVPWDFF